MKNFISKNKVFLIGLISAIALFIEQTVANPPVDFKVLSIGVLMIVISYVANTWKMAGLTITGIIGSLAFVFTSLWQDGSIDWKLFIVLSLAKILTAATSALNTGDEQKN